MITQLSASRLLFFGHDMRGYVKLRRGLFDHLKIISFSELKVYIGLLLLADFKDGKISISLLDLASSIGLSYKMVQLAIHRLKALGYVKFTLAKNQWKDTNFEIQRYNGGSYEEENASVTGSVNTSVPTTEATTTATTRANLVSSNNINELQSPKNVKNLKKESSLNTSNNDYDNHNQNKKDIKYDISNDYEYMQEDMFIKEWKEYLHMRKSKKKVATLHAQILILKKLHTYPIETAILMLQQSTINSWIDVYELKQQPKQQPKQQLNCNISVAEQIKRTYHENQKKLTQGGSR